MTNSTKEASNDGKILLQMTSAVYNFHLCDSFFIGTLQRQKGSAERRLTNTEKQLPDLLKAKVSQI